MKKTQMLAYGTLLFIVCLLCFASGYSYPHPQKEEQHFVVLINYDVNHLMRSLQVIDFSTYQNGFNITTPSGWTTIYERMPEDLPIGGGI